MKKIKLIPAVRDRDFVAYRRGELDSSPPTTIQLSSHFSPLLEGKVIANEGRV